MAVVTMPAFTLARGEACFTDRVFREWLSAAYDDPTVGVRAEFPADKGEKGEYTVTITVYPKSA